MDDYHRCNSPRSSNVDSLLEKFRLEITKKSDEDLINIKKLTITASNKSQDSIESSRDIDKKISDLEGLIKRLQEELDDISSNKPSYEDCAEVIPILYECEPEISEDEKTDLTEEKIEEEQIPPCVEKPSEPPSRVFPIILRDVDHVKEEEDEEVTEEEIVEKKICDEEVVDKEVVLVCDDDPILLSDKDIVLENTSDVSETISDMGQNVSYNWKQDEDYTKSEDNMKVSTDSIAVLIAELRAEIDETLHNLSKNDCGPTRKDFNLDDDD